MKKLFAILLLATAIFAGGSLRCMDEGRDNETSWDETENSQEQNNQKVEKFKSNIDHSQTNTLLAYVGIVNAVAGTLLNVLFPNSIKGIAIPNTIALFMMTSINYLARQYLKNRVDNVLNGNPNIPIFHIPAKDHAMIAPISYVAGSILGIGARFAIQNLWE